MFCVFIGKKPHSVRLCGFFVFRLLRRRCGGGNAAPPASRVAALLRHGASLFAAPAGGGITAVLALRGLSTPTRTAAVCTAHTS